MAGQTISTSCLPAGMLVLCRRAGLQAEECTPDMLLTLLWCASRGRLAWEGVLGRRLPAGQQPVGTQPTLTCSMCPCCTALHRLMQSTGSQYNAGLEFNLVIFT